MKYIFLKISIISVTLLSLFSCGGNRKQKIDKSKLKTYLLTNNHGMSVEILNFGGKVMSLKVPDREGTPGDVVLGYDTPAEYINGNPYFGAIIGRYANRIAGGKFTLAGKEYTLPKNNGNNCLHGGPGGFNNVIWEVTDYKNDDQNHYLKLKYISKDGEEGFPGKLTVFVTYSLNDDNELKIDYLATTDKKTVVNLTHHSFFNLKDDGKTPITGHILKINADRYTPINRDFIPTGEIAPVKGTPMDFTRLVAIGQRINNDFVQLRYANGYDHNWVLNKTGDSLTLAAEVYESVTGRRLQVFTTEPGLQFYSGNFLDGSDKGKNGVAYQFRTAFCLEAQHFPDSPNHPAFPTTVLNPGEEYRQTTIYKFSTDKADDE